uniref:Uncharacterized protein n=1 Tax=Arundo donax TaxID=35708 RepID=A0A0A9C9M7_ARUDO
MEKLVWRAQFWNSGPIAERLTE